MVAVAHAPDEAGQRPGHVLLEAQGLADLADGHARAVVDDGGADGGALAAVAAVEILDHLLAPLVLEIHVDVGRLAPLGRDEALEQHVDAGGIDGGDAEAIAHRAVGGRAAPLAEDGALLREAHHVVDGEEVARVVELGDERQLLGDQRLDGLGDAFWIVATGKANPQRLESLPSPQMRRNSPPRRAGGAPPRCGEGLGVGGTPDLRCSAIPPTLSLPHKGGGDGVARTSLYFGVSFFITLGSERPRQLLQIGLWRLAGRHRLVGVLVAQLGEIEGDALRDLGRAGYGLRISPRRAAPSRRRASGAARRWLPGGSRPQRWCTLRRCR